MVSYRVELAKSAAKDLRGIDRKRIPRIVAAIETLESDPRPDGCKKSWALTILTAYGLATTGWSTIFMMPR